MDFDSWTPSRVDSLRIKRLAIGYLVGAIAVAVAGSFIFLTSPNASAQEEEEPEIEVQLAKEPEPEPEPPPPAVVEEKPKPKPRVSVPIEIPKEAIKEAEPVPQQANEPDPFEEKTTVVEAPKPTVVEAPKPVLTPKAAKPQGPTRVLEDDTPPVPIAQSKPEYPASAKAAGLEGVVIVKYVISETGIVTDAKVLKGPPELSGVCLASVKTWRFKPALDFQGKPKAVTKIARFPFKLKT
jgi:periplasmic protein TonB